MVVATDRARGGDSRKGYGEWREVGRGLEETHDRLSTARAGPRRARKRGMDPTREEMVRDCAVRSRFFHARIAVVARSTRAEFALNALPEYSKGISRYTKGA